MTPESTPQRVEIMILKAILLAPFLNNWTHSGEIIMGITSEQVMFLMHVQASSQMQPEGVVTTKVSAAFIDLDSPVVIHVILIGSMLVEDIPMVDVDVPHEPMTYTKDHTHKDWEGPEETVDVALDTKGQEDEGEHDATVTELVERGDVTLTMWEIVKPW